MLESSRVPFLNGILNCSERAKGLFVCMLVQSCGDHKVKGWLFSEAGGRDGLT